MKGNYNMHADLIANLTQLDIALQRGLIAAGVSEARRREVRQHIVTLRAGLAGRPGDETTATEAARFCSDMARIFGKSA